MNWGPNDYESDSTPVINIVTLPRITLKPTRKITSPDYQHGFSDVDDARIVGISGVVSPTTTPRVLGGKLGGKTGTGQEKTGRHSRRNKSRNEFILLN